MLSMKLFIRDGEGELKLTGRLDAGNAPAAEEHVLEAAKRFDTLILNMENVEYVSSAGLRVIKRAHTIMRRKGGTLLLKGVTKQVMEIFEITGFAGIMKFI